MGIQELTLRGDYGAASPGGEPAFLLTFTTPKKAREKAGD